MKSKLTPNRLSSTMLALLHSAYERGGSYGADWCSGRGPEGGKVSARLRERDAVLRLRDAGYITTSNYHSAPEYNRGYAVHCTSIAYQLTDKGRAVVEQRIAEVERIRAAIAARKEAA